MAAVIAPRVSLSPIWISYIGQLQQLVLDRWTRRFTFVDIVSFSLTIGTTPIDSSALKVRTAFS